jgi:hypothetical protein
LQSLREIGGSAEKWLLSLLAWGWSVRGESGGARACAQPPWGAESIGKGLQAKCSETRPEKGMRPKAKPAWFHENLKVLKLCGGCMYSFPHSVFLFSFQIRFGTECRLGVGEGMGLLFSVRIS